MNMIEKNSIAFFAGVLVVLIATALFGAKASATVYKPPPPDDDTQTQTLTDNDTLTTTSDAAAAAGAISGSVSGSDSTSGSDSASSNGDMLSTNTSQFYALSLMFPGASDCFTGAQGGLQGVDADQGTSGFLGIHLLNTSCWLDKLASQESDIDINARLKCGDKKYRNAVAYDVPKRERQATCIRMKVDSGQDLMQSYKDRMQGLLDKANDDKRLLLDLREHDQQVCDESIERCQERLQK
jgi:hypothetical protein